MLHLAKGKIQEGKRTFECKSESTVDLVVEKSFVGKIEKGGEEPQGHMLQSSALAFGVLFYGCSD